MNNTQYYLNVMRQGSLSSRGSYTPDAGSRTPNANPFQDNFADSSQRLAPGSLLNKSYNHHGHASPYREGKKNSDFVHPNLTSSNVFYNFDYSYKHDLPNPRMLGAVKNDKFAPEPRERSEKPLSRSTILSRPAEEQFERPSKNLAITLDQAKLAKREKAEEASRSQQDKSFFSSRDRTPELAGNRRNSCTLAYNRGAETERQSRIPLETLPEEETHDKYDNRGSFTSRDERRMSQSSMFNDRAPETERLSTRNSLPVVEEQPKSARGTRSTAQCGKYCTDCINTSLADQKRNQITMEKEKDMEASRQRVEEDKKRIIYNHDMERSHRVISAKEQSEKKNQRALEDYKRMYGKQETAEEGGMVIDAIFNNQEERQKMMKAMQGESRNHNYNKMMYGSNAKEDERKSKLIGQANTLEVGEGYFNRYMTTYSVKDDIQTQIEGNWTKRIQDKEAENKIEQELLEANARAIERERALKKEKVENYKRMMEDQLASKTQQKEDAKEAKKFENSKAKYYANQILEDTKAQQRDVELMSKKNKEVFRQSLNQHQEIATYKKRYQQKKDYYGAGATSLQVGPKPDLHPCNGCDKLKEKKHLTVHRV